MNTTNAHTQLIAFLRPLGRRLRLRLGAELFTRTVWIVLAASVIVLAIGRLWPIDGYRIGAVGVLVAFLIGWMVYSLIRSIRPFKVAQRADDELSLRDRLATALVLSDPNYDLPSGFDRGLVSIQIADALAVARSIDPRRAFPMRVERPWLARAAMAALAGVVLLVLPNPMDAVVAERAQVSQAAQAEAEKLEELAQQVEDSPALDPEDKEELQRQIRRLIEQLRSNPGDVKQALADVAEFQEQLRAQLDPAAPAEAAAMDTLAQQLAQLAGMEDEPDDAAETARLLEELASELEQLSPEQREALAGALERAAGQTAGSNADLASALSALAQAMREGAANSQVQRAAAQAAQAMDRSADRQALEEALARALNRAESAERALAQAAARGGQAQGQGQGQQAQGQGQGQNQGQAQGQGQGQSQGVGQGQGQGNQVGGGGGSTADTLPPAVRPGSARPPTQPNRPFSTGELDTVYAPITAGEGRQEFVEGQPGSEGQTTTSEGQSPQPGADNPALVPYSQVYQRYVQIAGQAMERAYIPAALRDFVREYFSDLEP
jgi:hypothetical protein